MAEYLKHFKAVPFGDDHVGIIHISRGVGGGEGACGRGVPLATRHQERRWRGGETCCPHRPPHPSVPFRLSRVVCGSPTPGAVVRAP